LGGGILFALNVGMTLRPEIFGFTDSGQAVRFSFLSVGMWWAVFSIPVFLLVKEPGTGDRPPGWKIVKEGFSQLRDTFQKVRSRRNIFLFLLAYWLYIDGVDTIIRMAVDYGISIGFESNDLIVALLITQFIGFPSTFGFIYFGRKAGTKRAIYTAIAVYLFITLWGAFMRSRGEFFILAMIIGLVQGGIQAFSRSAYARIIPLSRSAEYFGFYNMIGKFAVIIGPVLMGGVGLLVRSMGYGSHIASRSSILSVSLLFLAGGTLFYFVKVERDAEHSG
ncbi:MAG TPA: MFS transporter, partial [Desulfobacteraceae bacterium]|nr:MFS transporter [Desulfobacteraceae bacterium]